jgi:uncharacterized membrane-anchored protein
LRILGALTAPILYVKLDAASLLNTATTKSSMPFKLPSLSNNGATIIIVKDAKGLIVICALLLGVMYGFAGEIITEFASTTDGGKAKTWYFVLSTKAVAKVVRNVVMATGGISPPSM